MLVLDVIALILLYRAQELMATLTTIAFAIVLTVLLVSTSYQKGNSMYKVTITRHAHHDKPEKVYTKLYTSPKAILNLYNSETAYVYFEDGETTPSLKSFKIETLVVEREYSINTLIKDLQ